MKWMWIATFCYTQVSHAAILRVGTLFTGAVHLAIESPTHLFYPCQFEQTPRYPGADKPFISYLYENYSYADMLR
jgi:hypothetical protein